MQASAELNQSWSIHTLSCCALRYLRKVLLGTLRLLVLGDGDGAAVSPAGPSAYSRMFGLSWLEVFGEPCVCGCHV